MRKFASFVVFSLSSWLLAYLGTSLGNVVESGSTPGIRILNGASQLALWSLEIFIISWPLFIVFGVSTWARVLTGGSILGALVALNAYNILWNRILFVHAWPVRVFGIEIADKAGHVNISFWVVIVGWAFVGFFIYVIPALLSKLMLESK